MKKKFFIGILLISSFYIADALSQLFSKLLMPYYYAWYKELFQPAPEYIVLPRYILSILYRIFELFLGVGILSRKEVFRKLALWMGYVTIAIVYWRHPFEALVKNARPHALHAYHACGHFGLTLAWLTQLIAWSTLVFCYALDIGVSVLVIYYFTRPRVKAWFSDSGNTVLNSGGKSAN